MTDDFDLSALREIFFSEADQQLRRLNDGLLELEGDHQNGDVLLQVFRAVHNLKGGAGLLGLDDLASMAHKMEDVLQALRDRNIELTTELFDTLFVGADALAAAKTAAETGRPCSVDAKVVLERLSAMQAEVTLEQNAEDNLSIPKPPAWVSKSPGKDGHESEVRESIHVRVDRVDRLLDLVGELTVRRLREQERSHALRELLAQVAIAESAATQAREEFLAQSGSGGAELPGLATALTYVQQLRKSLARFTKEFERATTELAQLSDEVQSEALGMRMVPIASIFDALPRLARDLARERGKLIRVVVEGRETELDKKILEGIADPLTHLIRNAVDHGIEEPEQRQRAGKPPEGIITLRAAQKGGHVVVELTDDGRGIDPGLVRTTAVRRGLISETVAAELDETETLNLVFRPGFSTSTTIDSVSGRGVGMDVVKNNVEALEGTVRILSQVGKGTSVTLVLPRCCP